MWSQWASWSSCSKECNGGLRTRARICPGEKSHPSITCGEERVQSEPCNTHACNTHVWAEWGSWSKCSTSNTNKQMRRRECLGDRPRRCPGIRKYIFFFKNKNLVFTVNLNIVFSLTCLSFHDKLILMTSFFS